MSLTTHALAITTLLCSLINILALSIEPPPDTTYSIRIRFDTQFIKATDPITELAINKATMQTKKFIESFFKVKRAPPITFTTTESCGEIITLPSSLKGKTIYDVD